MDLVAFANSAIPKDNGKLNLRHQDGDTMDIVATVLADDKGAEKCTKVFAQAFKGKSVMDTAKSVFDFILKNIRYQEDPLGIQYVKTPSSTWHTGFADCKSFSIFSASIFKNLGIKHAYRFASYNASTPNIYTHVYVIVWDENGNEIIVDPVYKHFNKQKPYKGKNDYMTKIYSVSGIGSIEPTAPGLKLTKDFDKIGAAEMDLLIAKDRLQIEKGIVEKMSGIGSLKAERYQDAIDYISELHGVVSNDNLSSDQKLAGIGVIEAQHDNGMFQIADHLHGIGSFRNRMRHRAMVVAERRKLAMAGVTEFPNVGFLKKFRQSVRNVAQKASSFVKKSGAVIKKFTKNVAKKVKEGIKAGLKILTLPMRLAVKGIVEVSLPKASPLFLYTFVPDDKASKLPAKAQRKRTRTLKIRKFIVDTIGMNGSHFDGIVRNGIMRHFGKSPEAVLSKYIGGNVSGIGMLSVAALIPVLIMIIQKLKSVFGKKGEDVDVSAEDAPDVSDFEGMDSRDSSSLQEDLRYNNPSPTELDRAQGDAYSDDFNTEYSGKSFNKSEGRRPQKTSDNARTSQSADDYGSGAGGGRRTNWC